jgi:predicted nucleic acid-binding protein
MVVILDTNGLSALAAGEPKLELLLRRADDVAVPVVVLGEYKYGVQQSRYRLRHERWLREFLVGHRVLAVDEGTTEHYAAIRGELKRRGRPIPVNDLWIAAVARQHGMPLLSRDKHFDVVPGLTRVGW